ncbi:zinc finger MYM-type protein 1-like [Tachysurus ichikawai]
MSGKHKGIQARLLYKNPRAFFVPCGAHTQNLVLAAAAKASLDANSYFGCLQKIYCLFSAAPQRIEAQFLAEEVGSFRFSVCSVVWYDILFFVQHVSKLMQSSDMQLDLTVDLLNKTHRSLTDYRISGFAAAQATAKDICDAMNVEATLKQKRLRCTKRCFVYEAHDETFMDALKKLEVTFFNAVVDAAKSSIEERFVSLSEVRDKFSVRLNFKSLTLCELGAQYETLSKALSITNDSDIIGRELALELTNLPELPSTKVTLLSILSFIHSQHLTEERLTGLAILSINHETSEELKYDVINDFAAKKSRKVKT